ncbi:deoxyguanosinetriphosphate triphosphohydrolase [Anoxynatronum buryatiense]|uniref:DGTPase n=1 Tax=Anoxynatronum buryatiense TaxID=489973 RepID=A0AA46AHF3_9CLOT|nr:deoxyguanosinetriphosphate triphosphohydrolase [Anoxynatronum buryatiense]SMP39362.1 dGTPase [Anoxynatronum buryatiense]
MSDKITIRAMTEMREKQTLAPYAQLSADTRGREEPEPNCDIRTVYQRDRDRIIHSEFFRRLKGKTQVFILKSDFYRTRLTHTLELSQIARTIARALGLNEDLIEAIALGHDLGHTCFGHSGEEVLQRLTGFFSHNEQSLRIVDQLEREGRGLNLTVEVRDGILNHTGDGIPITMEGKLVKIADRITYLCHDIQDSLSAGILKAEDIPPAIRNTLGDSHSQRVNSFVQDMAMETVRQLALGNEPRIYQSSHMEAVMQELRSFMFEKVYYGELCMREKEKATHIVECLYREYTKNMTPRESADIIAGMTDEAAIKAFQELMIPIPS